MNKFTKTSQQTMPSSPAQNATNKYVYVPTRSTGGTPNPDAQLFQSVRSLGFQIRRNADNSYTVWK